MAEKKTTSRAEAAVNKSRKNIPDTGKNSGGKADKKPAKTPKVRTEYDQSIPSHIVSGFIYLVCLIVAAVLCINPEGFLLLGLRSIVLGLVGWAGFYALIPVLLYLCCLQFFGRKERRGYRCFCGYALVMILGAFYHLLVEPANMTQGVGVISDLYHGGVLQYSGGVICGGAAMLLRLACGKVLSYLLLVLFGMVTMLGCMNITVPSLIQAIANRPRMDWDDEEEQNYVEPATLMVNRIAEKQIEHRKRQRTQKAAQPAPHAEQPRQEQPKLEQPARQEPAAVLPVAAEPARITDHEARVAELMSTLDLEVGAPTGGRPHQNTQESPEQPSPRPERKHKEVPVADFLEEDTPVVMPVLEREDEPVALPPVQKREQPKAAEPRKPEPRPEKPGKVTAKDAAESARQVAEEIAQVQEETVDDYRYPPIDLLKAPSRNGSDGTEEMRENSRRLNETLASFRIDAHITNVTRGPSVTRYEVELDKGVRLSKLTGCADDIALSLGASGVRIAAVPGKISIVGIEVPNRSVTMVSLREVIASREFESAKSQSSFAVGKDIGGSCIVGNIAKMPHLLIAGTTGSGKSVCMNSVIISLLYKSSPRDVKLIMVDPKMVELGIYNGIPHLLIPVVTDPKKAAGSLQWAVEEMLRRYKLMSDVGVRDLESYNSVVDAEENGQHLPQIVTIIDELADLMLVAAKEVEDSICRIAQMGRAAGMHLIIATQRPSADVITGLMKANIPSRIAFSVASSMESRIILDTQGAEKLVGKGDMLYAPIGCGKPLRVQGCFVTDSEVEAVAGFVKQNFAAEYNQKVLDDIEQKAQQTGKGKPQPQETSEAALADEDGDEMLPAAVDVILETGQASVSMLQRRLKLGYARAARIVDEMEEKGIVGPFQGSKPRAILVTKEQWNAMRGTADVPEDFSHPEEDYGEDGE